MQRSQGERCLSTFNRTSWGRSVSEGGLVLEELRCLREGEESFWAGLGWRLAPMGKEGREREGWRGREREGERERERERDVVLCSQIAILSGSASTWQQVVYYANLWVIILAWTRSITECVSVDCVH